MARVLVYTPTYDNRLQDETVKSIKAMSFNGDWHWELSDDNPHPGRDMRNCVHQFRKGRQLALDGGYDAMLSIEHDMIVPADCLQKLWDTDAPVVYGTYMLRHGMNAINLFQYVGERNIGMSLSLYPRELAFARQRGWAEVSGAGFGCILMRRVAMEACPFRDVGNAPDLPFAKDCVNKRIKQIGRTDVECGHIDLDWNNGMALWPWEGGFGIVARVLGLQDVNAQDDGQSVQIRKGKYASVSVDAARELQRAGYVRITNEADVVADAEAKRMKGVMGTREIAAAPEQETVGRLEAMTVAELRALASNLGVEGYSSMRKAELVEAIQE